MNALNLNIILDKKEKTLAKKPVTSKFPASLRTQCTKTWLSTKISNSKPNKVTTFRTVVMLQRKFQG